MKSPKPFRGPYVPQAARWLGGRTARMNADRRSGKGERGLR
jgi:hypothetical protein